MKKEYLTCSRHRDLRLKNEDELRRHVEDEHDGEIEDCLGSYTSEAVDRVCENLSETIKLDPDEEAEQEPTIDFDKVIKEISAGRQRTLGVSHQ